MKRLALVLAAVLVAGSAVAAHAGAADCPEGVATVTGTNPSYDDLAALLDQAAAAQTPPIPPQILRAIAYQETHWQQYDAQGHVVISQGDDVCGVGIMQVTAADDPDPQRLATDVAYNVARGAAILHDKWVYDQAHSNAPADRPADSDDDPAVVENWYHAICLYNGCSGTGEGSYVQKVAEIVADPFRRVGVPELRPYLPIRGFTEPDDADESYVFPGAFQARLDPPSFVFYDNTTREITKTVTARTHQYQAAPPAVTYQNGMWGPDGPGVTCEVACGGWRLTEGRGTAGRAHWTYSGLTEATRIRWAPVLPRTGTYRVNAYVPFVATAAHPLSHAATYHLAGTTVTVDQAAKAGQYVPLGDRTLGPGSTVWLNDVADTAGLRIGADAMWFSAVTKMELTASRSTVAYGTTTTLTMRLTHVGASPAGIPGRKVRFYKRRLGTSTWTYAGTFTTGPTGAVSVTQQPASNAEYFAKYAPGPGDALPSEAPVRRVTVAPVVKAALSRTTVARGTAVTLSTSVAPSHAGQGVYLQRSYSGSWRNVLSRTLNSGSAASFAFALSTPGTYYFRVYKPADADHVAAYSAVLTLRVT
ncbi:MAG TPA: hypothetical protein VFQ85_13830 [Mycobacteriales bacterium]|nr:hypothetical protein [Mycobacteriales bacterium]